MTRRTALALAAALLATAATASPAAAGAPTPVAGEPDLARVGFTQTVLQAGPKLVWRLDTRVRWTRALLASRRLCLIPSQKARTLPGRIACLALAEEGVLVRREHELADGTVQRRTIRGATVTFRGHRIRVLIPLDALGMRPGRAAFSTRLQTRGDDCLPTSTEEPPPAEGATTAAEEPAPEVVCAVVRPIAKRQVVVLAGGPPGQCVARGASYRTQGPTSPRRIALTFDDGPSAYTSRFLDVLKAKGVHGTFFLIGQQVASGANLVRRAVAEGNEVGNHSWNHANLGGGGPAATSQLTSTSAAIARATGGLVPCVFRAPYGSVGSDLIARARDLGMLTIQWSADPTNWARPGSGAIFSRLLAQASPGGILLMHDGGGDRSQTLAALPDVIDALQARGYELVTVSELLGLEGPSTGWPEG